MKNHLAIALLTLVCCTHSYADFEWWCIDGEFHGELEIKENMKAGILRLVEENASLSETPLTFSVTPAEGRSSFHIQLENQPFEAHGRLSTLTRGGFVTLKLKNNTYILGCELIPYPTGEAAQ